MLKSLLRVLKIAEPGNHPEFDYAHECVVDAEANDSERLKKVLFLYNAAKVRNCIDPELLNRIVVAATSTYKTREAMIAAGTVPESSKLSYRRRTILLDELNIEGVSTTSFLMPRIIIGAAREYLGKEPVQAISSVRAIVPGAGDQRLPFHQDQTILQSPLLNIWIPLTPCGITAPGLEVAVTGKRQVLEVAGSKDDEVPVERARIDEELVLTTFGQHALWHPVMMPGEALIFTGTTAHRTFITPRMTDTRMSIELRLV